MQVNVETLAELATFIPQRLRRSRPKEGPTRKLIGMHPEDHARVETLAGELHVSIPVAIITLLEYVEDADSA